MGGFHPTLVPDEASEYAEAIVHRRSGGALAQGDRGFSRRAPAARLPQAKRPPLAGLRPDRSIFAGKRYLPVGLVEAGRGCHFRCEFCAVQTYFGSTQTRRPGGRDPRRVPARSEAAAVSSSTTTSRRTWSRRRSSFRALIPLKVRWVSQASINAAHDEEFLRLIKASGCQGLLIGFESLNEQT